MNSLQYKYYINIILFYEEKMLALYLIHFTIIKQDYRLFNSYFSRPLIQRIEKNVIKFVYISFYSFIVDCPVGRDCRIHRLLLCRGVRPPPTNECPVYDTKQSDSEVPAILELWGMRSTPLLPSLPGPLWPGLVVPDKGPINGLNTTKR